MTPKEIKELINGIGFIFLCFMVLAGFFGLLVFSVINNKEAYLQCLKSPPSNGCSYP